MCLIWLLNVTWISDIWENLYSHWLKTSIQCNENLLKWNSVTLYPNSDSFWGVNILSKTKIKRYMVWYDLNFST